MVRWCGYKKTPVLNSPPSGDQVAAGGGKPSASKVVDGIISDSKKVIPVSVVILTVVVIPLVRVSLLVLMDFKYLLCEFKKMAGMKRGGGAKIPPSRRLKKEAPKYC